LAANTAGIEALLFQRFTSFNAYFVLPAVTEVILVEETLVFTEFEFVREDSVLPVAVPEGWPNSPVRN